MAMVVRILPGKEGHTRRCAYRALGNGAGKPDALGARPIQVRALHHRVQSHAHAFGIMLVGQDIGLVAHDSLRSSGYRFFTGLQAHSDLKVHGHEIVDNIGCSKVQESA